MGPLSPLREQDENHGSHRYGAEELSAVLPQVQAGDIGQRTKIEYLGYH